ncbi:MAG: DUF1501 domain-containing protein, partial [Planctomycetes bacterium]|nr:DUF1501 domain-containing protein [Planctomycetota bacterium]
MNHSTDPRWLQTRRAFLGQASQGLGAAALASLLNSHAPAATTGSPGELPNHPWPPAIHPLHFAPKAKAVIFLCMAGGPSHLETFDYKSKLAEMDGKPMPSSLTEGQPIAQLQNRELKCLAPQHPFKRWGESGQEIATVLPHIGSIADDICVVKSLVTKAINHDPAHTFMNTGTTISGRPSMGSWIVYGLGSECDNLPGFVVLTSVGGGQSQPIASRQWHSGFLPSRYQGVPFHAKGDPVLYVRRPAGVDPQQQRDVVDAVKQLSQLR